MNHDQFTHWLQGFVEMNGNKEPSSEQWQTIKNRLRSCFAEAQYAIGGSGGIKVEHLAPIGFGHGLGSGVGLHTTGGAGASLRHSTGGAGWPIDKYGNQLTNAQVALMQGQGGDGGC